VWVVASSLLFALALLLTAQIRGEARWLGSGGCLAAAVTAGTVLWRGAMRRGRDDDLGEAVAFGLLATAAWVWGWGEVIWMGYTLFLHEVPPFPSMADVGFLVTPVLATCALGVWIATTTGWRVAAGVVLDGLVVAPALLLLLASTAWASVVRRVVTDNVVLAVGSAYPLLGSVMSTVLLQMLPGAFKERRVAQLVTAGALLVLAVTDIVWASAVVVDGRADRDAAVVVIGWFAGFGLLVAGGTSPMRRPEWTAVVDALAKPRRWFLLTFLPAVGAIGVSVYQLTAGHVIHPLELTCLLIIIAAAAARQLVLPSQTD
jgi:hypothetical protein